MKRLWLCVFVGLALAMPSLGQAVSVLYRNDFEKADPGKLPEEFMVIEGEFTVAQDNGNRFLELPGAPLDSFGLQFGPAEKEGVVASARIFGTAKGRRLPTFGLGLNGLSGYRVQVSPGKKRLELFRGDEVKASVPYEWDSGVWTELRIQVRKVETGWKVEGKAWTAGKAEPGNWLISIVEPEELPAGRAGVFASPFSGTPLRFDDLTVARLIGK